MGIRPEPIVIVGNGPLTSKLIEEVGCSDTRCCVVGVIDHDEPSSDGAAVPWGPIDRLSEILERIRPSRIVVALGDRRGRLPLQPLLESRLRGVVVEDALDFYERLTGKIAIEALTPGALIHAKGFRQNSLGQIAAHFLSLLASIVALVLLAPVLAAIALLIRLDSPGPIFFLQERIGRGGIPFDLIKFRTMHPADQRPSEWVQDNEGRITRIGQWLRRYRLDELPQLINVLRGQMNLIGPRPHPTSNQLIFMQQIAYYGLRSTVRPGVTGWAQIRYGYANNLEEETEKMRYDLYYIKNQTVWLDLKILLETIFVMFTGDAAADRRRRARRAQARAWRASLEGALEQRPAYWPTLVDSAPTARSVVRQ
jgi:exopolysaccharide biosynthesis polyprenyl glycosylphosphotransferase